MASKTAEWVHQPWVGFDTETTGVSPTEDRIVTAAVVTWHGGTVSGSRTWLADPGIPIPERATAVHGISTAFAREHGSAPDEVLEQINAALAQHLSEGSAVVIFNAGYDLPLLAADSRRHGVPTLADRVGAVAPVIDPLVLDRALEKYRRGKRTLGDLCRAYGVEVSSDAHQADADAAMTTALLAKMLDRFPQLCQLGASEITDFQRQAHVDWAEDFEAFLRSKGRDSHISRTWF